MAAVIHLYTSKRLTAKLAQATETPESTTAVTSLIMGPNQRRRRRSPSSLLNNLPEAIRHTASPSKRPATGPGSYSPTNSNEVAQNGRRKERLEVEDDDWFLDPITYEVMIDPVKCNDGYTYNRWTIVDNRLSVSPFTKQDPLLILCDDISVRGRLFRRFPGQEKHYRERRIDYRNEGIKAYKAGHHTHTTLYRLQNILLYAPQDEFCREAAKQLEGKLSGDSRDRVHDAGWRQHDHHHEERGVTADEGGPVVPQTASTVQSIFLDQVLAYAPGRFNFSLGLP